MSPVTDTTQLLIDARAGDEAASRLLSRHVHDTLREIVQVRASQPPSRDPASTPVQEAYRRLVDTQRAGLDGRAHFLTLAARAMRHMLVDRARARTARRRTAMARSPGTPAEVAADERSAELIALAEALEQLTALDPRLGNIANVRFFGGLGFDELSEIVGRPSPTLKRDWIRARAWLYRAMREGDPDALSRPRWREIDQPFSRALELGGAERASYLNGLKAGDHLLARAVTELLASTDEAEAVLGERVTVFAAPLLAGLTEDDWGDGAQASVRAAPLTAPAPLPNPNARHRRPLVLMFSTLVLLLAGAAAIALWPGSGGRADTGGPVVGRSGGQDADALAGGREGAQVEGEQAVGESESGSAVGESAGGPAIGRPDVQEAAAPDSPRTPVPDPRTLRPNDPQQTAGPPDRPAAVGPTADSLTRLARAYRKAGRSTDAEQALRDALASRVRTSGAGSLPVAAAEWELGDFLRSTGKRDEAASLLRSSLVTRQRLASPRGPEVATSLAALALAECEQGHGGVADSLFRLAADIYGQLPAIPDSMTPIATRDVRCR